MTEERKQYMKRYFKENHSKLRKYRTDWERSKRQAQYLAEIKELLKPINRLLANTRTK